jgi:hypothetical protein
MGVENKVGAPLVQKSSEIKLSQEDINKRLEFIARFKLQASVEELTDVRMAALEGGPKLDAMDPMLPARFWQELLSMPRRSS